METLPIRLTPGQDLRTALEVAVRSQNCQAAFVLAGIGSLSAASLRFAGVDQLERLVGDMEILSLSGTVAFGGAALAITAATSANPAPRSLGVT